MVNPEVLLRTAQAYADQRDFTIETDTPLGFGQDGKVWRSSRDSAVKVLERERNYRNERDAYERLAVEGVSSVGPFDVPRLVDFDDDLQVIEIGIVTPPYLLDFGKAYVD